MLLTIGYITEKTFGHFISNLKQSSVTYKILDLSNLSKLNRISIIEDYNNQNLVIELDNEIYDFSKFRSFYTRLFYTDLGNNELNILFSKMISSIYSFLESTNKMVVNKPSSGDSNVNKFVHSKTLGEYGFKSIRSMISTDQYRVSEIIPPDSSWITKGCSSIKTKAALIDHYIFSRLIRLPIAPALFQPRIIGDNVRIHFVGNEYFAERIISKRLDYRFSDDEVSPNKYLEIIPPAIIIEKCLRYCRSENLFFAGFDFIVTENEEWFILECNTMPGYESYDKRCQNKISTALIKILADSSDNNPFEKENQNLLPEPFIPSFNRPKVNFL
ncbi:hypothetical protein [Chryseobacterium sp. KCF3-3]|uniref:hypothetical protein n=1 Tax=Chryseobacterium sp. KCF3-3 TaxID=3231511 RepID=UPI0038B345F8